ncbi:UDP-N-acetylglucosamine--LPS N-acetylglucosamine transferase [Sneathiella sp. P13V-1]|nr:UDP-N-acetylglucosamine--LPS N-acetylglucosamine transferase [Sneathiella sp. P13V-1]
MTKTVLAIASAGGHWVQLQRLRPAWDGCHVIYVTTKQGYYSQVIKDAEARNQTNVKYFCVQDANRWQKLKLLHQLFQIGWIILKNRPNVIISTGAAPGFFALKIGKLLGAKTIWLDSIANAEELSLSGEKVSTSADLWLTQWPELAGKMAKERKTNQHIEEK